MIRIVAVDPGPTQTAIVHLANGYPEWSGILDTADVIRHLRMLPLTNAIAIEMIASYGMPVGAEVFRTCVNIGRFAEVAHRCSAPPIHLLTRSQVKLHLCKSPRANDSTVRQALIDRFGPGKEKAIGLKARPGPLYNFKADKWAALAVACAFADGVKGEQLLPEPAAGLEDS